MTLQSRFLFQNLLKPHFLFLRPCFLPSCPLTSTSYLLYHIPCVLFLTFCLCPTFPYDYSFPFYLTFFPKPLISWLLYIFSFSVDSASPPVSFLLWPIFWPRYPASCPLHELLFLGPFCPSFTCLSFPHLQAMLPSSFFILTPLQVQTHLQVIEERMNQSLGLLDQNPHLAQELRPQIRECLCPWFLYLSQISKGRSLPPTSVSPYHFNDLFPYNKYQNLVVNQPFSLLMIMLSGPGSAGCLFLLPVLPAVKYVASFG